MKLLLTGATGFLGNNLLRVLLQRGDSVTALIRQKDLPESLRDLKVELVRGELFDPATYTNLSVDFDVLVHCAAQIQIGGTKLDECRLANVESTRVLAEFCRRLGKRMIHVSTVDTLAYSQDGSPKNETERSPSKPPSTYVVTKLEAEVAFLDQVKKGLDGVMVHPGFMLGKFDWRPSSAEMMIAVAKFRPPFAPAGGASVVHVNDVANGIVNAIQLGKPGENYILGGVNLKYLLLWQRMAEVIGCRRPRFPLPNWLAAVSGKFGDVKAKIIQRESNLNSMVTRMGQLDHFYSSEKAARDLGYEITPIDAAIQDCWDWIKLRHWA